MYPEEERKSLETMKKNYNKKITSFIKIAEANKLIGFLIMNSVENTRYMQLDYFAILPEYQNKGYGTKAIKELKKVVPNYDAIFVEIEKLGWGANKEENKIREKRAKFYERLDFHKLNANFKWFNSLFLSVYYLKVSENQTYDEKEILNNIFEIYYKVHSKKKVDENCEIIKWFWLTKVRKKANNIIKEDLQWIMSIKSFL